MSTALQTAVDQQQTQIAVADRTADESPEWRQVLRQAEKLAAAPLTPVHLKVSVSSLPSHIPESDRRRVAWQQTVANCILVANQAQRWGADLFAVAGETYVVGNKLGYQGKLIAAIVNTRGGLTDPLQTIYSTGKGDALAAVIYGKMDGKIPKEAYPLLEAYADNEDREALRKLAPLGVLAIRISVGQSKTKNDMWHKDPEQKLFYSGATKWARRHAPELMLGILSNDDLDRMREDELHVGHEQTQSRIGMVIPASLDASGLLPSVPVEFSGSESEPRGDGEAADQQPSEPDKPAETAPQTEPAPDPDPAMLDQYHERTTAALTLQEVEELRKHAEANKALGGEALAQVFAWCEGAETRIRASRGGRANGGQKKFA